ncbi:MAG: hypothetical protein LBS89_03550 [Zoogloeaceae bacterium]|jgi:hypothetical protein|nr:hypothetical protein [Zoogloeaceae bacterium]
MPKIYHFHATTGELIGVGEAQESPLEPGKYLIPHNATLAPTPDTGEHEAAVFDIAAQEWGVFPDFRGQKYWLPDGSEHEISAIGETVPGGALDTPPPPPPPTPEEIVARLTAEIQQRLDDFAKTRGYDGILSACTYATSAIPKFAAEGQYAVNARDATWQTAYAIMDAVLAGGPVPDSVADIDADLPDLQWPES